MDPINPANKATLRSAIDASLSAMVRRDVLASTLGMTLGASAIPVMARGSARAEPLDTVADDLLARFPETAVYNGVPAARDGGALARRMDDWSAAGRDADLSVFRQTASVLAGMKKGSGALADEALDAGRAIVGQALATASIAYGRQNPLWFSGHAPYVIAPIAGPHIGTPNVMMVQQSVSTPAAVDAWLEKLDGFAGGFAAVRDRLLHDEAAGCVPPAVLLQKALPQIDAFLTGPAEQHPLVVSLRTRMAKAGLPDALQAAALARATTALERRARPAYAALRDAVAALARRGREQDGVWAQRDGEALYAANLRALGNTTLGADEIHRIGLEEARRIAGKLDARLAAQGLTTGSIGERMAAIAGRPDLRFADSVAGQEDVLEHARRLVRTAEGFYPRILPPEFVPAATLEVRRVPPVDAAGASLAFADPPSLDGRTPGVFWINVRDMAAVTRVSLPTMTFHEAVPGHFTAAAAALRAGDRPILLQIANFNAFNEGWALYAERLMAELGVYRDDPWGELGWLIDDLWRAVRLVVDTGLHHRRWTRAQAIAFMAQQTGKPDSLVTAEIERYMGWPGQALGYKLGQLRLSAMRREMQARLGAGFTLPRFHRAVLGAGSLPLAQVARRVRAA